MITSAGTILQRFSIEPIFIILGELFKFSIICLSTKGKDSYFSFFIKQTKLSKKAFEKYLSSFKESIAQLGETEISYWQSYIDKIKGYSHEEAISELIKSLKINEKISAIQKYVDSLKG